MVAEYENAPNGEKGAVLRHEGLYSSHIIEWTRARDAGALTGGPAESTAPAMRVKRAAEQVELEKLWWRNEKLESDLKKTRMTLDIVGKAHALGGAFRERGERRTAAEILDTAFAELCAADISAKRSCVLTGMSRASPLSSRQPERTHARALAAPRATTCGPRRHRTGPGARVAGQSGLPGPRDQPGMGA